MNIFDNANDFIRSAESSIVNLISAIAPWAAPLAPAYMAFFHMRDRLEFPFWVAFALSGVIEILGLSTVSTILAFWNYNRKAAKTNKAPVLVPLVAFLFYLSVVLTLNVLLELPNQSVWLEISARALLTLLSIPAALILAVRTMHTDMIANLKAERAEHKAERAERNRTKADTEPDTDRTDDRKSEMLPVYDISERTELTAEMIDHLKNGHTPETLSAMFPNVTDRTIRRWKAEING